MADYFNLPRVEIITQNGRKYTYYRHNRQMPRIKLPDAAKGQLVCTAAWVAAQKEIEERPKQLAKAKGKRSLGPMLKAYVKSRGNTLKRSTRHQYTNLIKRIVGFYGRIPIKDVSFELTTEFLESFNSATSARECLKLLKGAFRWFVQMRYLDYSDIEQVPRPKVDTIGFQPWTRDEIEKFRAAYNPGSWPRLVLEILLLTGCRVSDAIKLNKHNFWGDALSYTSKKSEITAYIHTGEHAHLFKHVWDYNLNVIFHPRTGKKFKNEDQFRHMFKQVCERIEIHKTAHGLRKSAAINYAEAGLTANELCAVLGWKHIATAQIYVKDADRKTMGTKATKAVFKNSDSPAL